MNHHLEVFAVTLDGELRHRWHDGSWSPWTAMPLPRDTRALHIGAGADGQWLDLFIVSATGRLLHRWWGEYKGWSGWNDWGGDFAGPVYVASVHEHHNEVWTYRGGALVHSWLASGTWSDWWAFNWTDRDSLGSRRGKG